MFPFIRTLFKLSVSCLVGVLLVTSVAAEEQLEATDLNDGLVVRTSHGVVKGALSAAYPTIREFKGIPFAAPPVGELRWRAPQPVNAWEGTRDATTFAPRCVQPEIQGGFYTTDPQPTSEDCLYLNVWSSGANADAKLPVMVWIHGGAFILGSGSEAIYHGASLANSGVVVVTVNYRLGLFGFYAHPALSAETESGTSGNQALYDQVTALQWVQDNITTFGGDPNNVTIFGESAGSMSVCYMVATPLAKGLFNKAIGQSGGCFVKHASLDEPGASFNLMGEAAEGSRSGYDIGVQVAEALGVESHNADALKVMRAMSSDEITAQLAEKGVTSPWRSIFVDGVMFPDQMRTLMADGRASSVNTIAGSTKDEGVMLWAQVPEAPREDWEAFVRKNTHEYAEALITAYDKDASKSRKTATQEMMSDSAFAAEMRTWARLVEAQGKNAFVYVFNHAPPIDGMGRSLGAFHGGEIQYVFQSHSGANAIDGAPELWDDSDRRVADFMRHYWVNFAKTGDPNGEGLPTWPKFAVATNQTLAIEVNPSALADFRKAKLDVFEQIMQDEFDSAEFKRGIRSLGHPLRSNQTF